MPMEYILPSLRIAQITEMTDIDTVEILKRFEMMDCKAMATPMASNLELMSDASSKTADTTMYC